MFVALGQQTVTLLISFTTTRNAKPIELACSAEAWFTDTMEKGDLLESMDLDLLTGTTVEGFCERQADLVLPGDQT